MGPVLLGLLGMGCLVALSLGIWLLIDPRAGQSLGRPVAELLHQPLLGGRVERVVYRHHLWFGGGITLASLFILASLWRFAGHPLPLLRLKTGEAVFWESLVLFSVVGGLFSLGVGLVVLARPSLLRTFEAWANRHVNRENLASSLVTLRQWLLHLLAEHPRAFAVFLVAASGSILWIVLGHLARSTHLLP